MYPQRGLNYFSSLDGNTGMYSSFDGLDSITRQYKQARQALVDMQRLSNQETSTKNSILEGFSAIASFGGQGGKTIGSLVKSLAMSDEDAGVESLEFAKNASDIDRKFQNALGTAQGLRVMDSQKSIYNGGLAGNSQQLNKIQLT